MLSIATFGSLISQRKVCPIVDVQLCLKGYPAILLRFYVVPTICEPLVSQPITTCVQSHPHLRALELADTSDENSSLPIDLLVGADYYWELVTGNTCRGEGGPTAIHTIAGWVLSGPSTSNSSRQSAVNLSVTHVLHTGAAESQCVLDEQLQAFWNLESIGINALDAGKTSVLNEFKDKIWLNQGRYEEFLPWKDQHRPLPDNYELCHRRLQGLIRRLQQDQMILEMYDSIIRQKLQQGIVELTEAMSKNQTCKQNHQLNKFVICHTMQ